jgi:hypothetical protein
MGMKAIPAQAAPEENGENAGEGDSSRLPGAMESSEGGAPEVTVHKESSIESSSDLSPEEQAVNVITAEPDASDGAGGSEDDDEAALAEGRVEPPVAGREGAA